jgi:hypothetical protein
MASARLRTFNRTAGSVGDEDIDVDATIVATKSREDQEGLAAWYRELGDQFRTMDISYKHFASAVLN